MRKLHAVIVACLAGAGCAETTTTDPTETSPHVAEAAQSAQMIESIARLGQQGWRVAPFAQARAREEGDKWAVELAATKGSLAVDLVLAHENGAEKIVLNPHDAASAAAFTQDEPPPSDAVARTNGTGATTDEGVGPNPEAGACDPGCNPPDSRVCFCTYWSCSYIESYSYTWGCVAFIDNPFGQTYDMVYEGGSTDPASCAGWTSDVFGNTKVCPWPARDVYRWSVCSQFIDG